MITLFANFLSNLSVENFFENRSIFGKDTKSFACELQFSTAAAMVD